MAAPTVQLLLLAEPGMYLVTCRDHWPSTGLLVVLDQLGRLTVVPLGPSISGFRPRAVVVVVLMRLVHQGLGREGKTSDQPDFPESTEDPPGAV